MASKLPVRKNVKPLFEIASELEKCLEKSLPKKSPEKTTIEIKEFSANFNGHNENEVENRTEDDEKEAEIKINKKNCKLLLKEKDKQIEKLIERLTILHNCNAQFAAENEKLQKRECEQCKLFQNQQELLREEYSQIANENQQLRNDVKMMKTLVYRLNVQIERYQDFIRQNNPEDLNSFKLNFDAVPQKFVDWGPVNSHTLGPLLHAYTEIINEKTDLIDQYENDLSHFTGRLKQIIEENEVLQKEMDEIKRHNETWSTDRTRLQAQLDICRNKAELQTKRGDLAKEKLVEVVRVYEQKIQSQHLDLERLQDAYSRSKAELTALRNIQHQSPETVVESLKECQKLFEELKGQHDIEREKLAIELKDSKENLRQIELKNQTEMEKYEKLYDEHQRQKESNLILNNKVTALRQSLARLRISRETLKSRLKILNSPSKMPEKSYRQYKNFNIPNAEASADIQNVHLRYVTEIEKLARKLNQRDETLKKVLQATIHKTKK